MKLWKKLSLVTVTVLTAATFASGTAVIYQSARYNRQKTVESCEQQLISAAYAIGRELDTGLLESYREATKHAYINFVVKKYGASQYILLEDDQVACNLTPFELSDPGDGRWGQRDVYSVIQKAGEQYILIAGKKVPDAGSGQYKLVLVKDISELYQDVKRQAIFSLAVFAGAAAVSMFLIFLVTRRILRPLRELQSAAKDISGGDLKRRANVRTRDEVGDMAKAFNSMAERIEGQVTELSNVSQQQRQLLGSLAHEMKTPMTSIIGYSDSLLHVNLKKEQQERAILHIYESCSRLGRLGSKLMSLIGLYENESILMEKVSMEELFAQVAAIEEYNLEQKGIGLKYSCSMGERWVDRDLFESLLINLIDNGAKASREGSSIYLSGQGDVITVRDEGCGIPKEEIGRVTEAFYMVDKARSRKEGGCGLGLSLCSMIAKLHGAELVIKSEVGVGTEVSVVFQDPTSVIFHR